MNSNNPALSVVIVSWNTRKLVLECLQSLQSAVSHLPIEIIVVDNASADDTIECVRKEFPAVQLIQNQTNLGFAKANNIGIRRCTGRYVCLINSDVQVPEGCLEKMLAYMEQHADIGMLGPKMVLPDGSIGQSCMRSPTVWRWFCRALALDSLPKVSGVVGGFLMKDFNYDRVTDVDILTGWFWMVRRGAMDQVGLLDEAFFFYGEDIDWPKRFHKAGWRVVFYSEAEAMHYCGASSSKAAVRFYIEMNRANLQYCQRYHSWFGIAGFWMAMWLHEVIRIIGYGLAYVFNGCRYSEAKYKVRRSIACLLWMMGLWQAKEGEVR